MDRMQYTSKLLCHNQKHYVWENIQLLVHGSYRDGSNMNIGWNCMLIKNPASTNLNWPPGGQKYNFWSIAVTETVKTWKLGRIAFLSRIHHQTSQNWLPGVIFYTANFYDSTNLVSYEGLGLSQFVVLLLLCILTSSLHIGRQILILDLVPHYYRYKRC